MNFHAIRRFHGSLSETRCLSNPSGNIVACGTWNSNSKPTDDLAMQKVKGMNTNDSYFNSSTPGPRLTIKTVFQGMGSQC